MTSSVKACLLISMDYGCVGTAHLRNPNPIIMLQFPECPQFGARGVCCPTLGKEFTTR